MRELWPSEGGKMRGVVVIGECDAVRKGVGERDGCRRKGEESM